LSAEFGVVGGRGLGAAGFEVRETWTDPAGDFAVTLARLT